MGLDFVIANAPEHRVTLQSHEHDVLQAILPSGSLLQRLPDCWSDAEFAIGELQSLDDELLAMQAKLDASASLQPFLFSLRLLVNAAVARQSPILAEGD